jgi:uncharacterized protein
MAMNDVDKLRHAYQSWHDSRGASVAVWLDLVADDVVMKSLADGAPELEFSADGRRPGTISPRSRRTGR